jgi:hypothetical protein
MFSESECDLRATWQLHVVARSCNLEISTEISRVNVYTSQVPSYIKIVQKFNEVNRLRALISCAATYTVVAEILNRNCIVFKIFVEEYKEHKKIKYNKN